MGNRQSSPLLDPLIAKPPPTPQPTKGLPNRSFVYPIQGITHLIAHRSLHPSLYSRVVPLCLLSVFIVGFMFAFLWLPHVFVLTLFHEPFPKSAAATMILTESATVVAIAAEAFFTEKQVVDIFDLVLLSGTKRTSGLNRRAEAMIRVTRDLVIDEDGNRKLGEHRVSPYVKFRDSLRMGLYFILELPLCLIPVFGTAVFLCLQGYHIGPMCHYRYFQLLGWDKRTRRKFIRRNRFRYFLFGTVHMCLQLVPIASIFFLFSTGTGAALWAVDFEKRLWTDQGARRWEDEEMATEVVAGIPPPKFGVTGPGGGPKSWLTFWRKN
ncbi:hypothetical protein FN846DRAFT_953899 [Sphaerosporella brunnea]|uniref:Etoposide-induced protein 2.4-domain-containing protein n=1 Tax=Sphaerosporella brunnea TaxID=1250544 RepID=A0A5J5EUN3_9PEZI|nr:hypothetical protein FN846DRAFT_953899 [Sphaerosporella brunnea]